MRPHSSLAAVAVAVALPFVLAGCFTASPPTTTQMEELIDAATGELIEGSGYSFNAPEGWVVPPDPPPVADVYVIDADAPSDSFVSTINVLLSPAMPGTPEERERNGVVYLEGDVGATEVEVRPRVTIAGSEALHFTAQLHKGADYWMEQYILIEDETTYTITFASGLSTTQEDREAIAESVLATWMWVTSTATPGEYVDSRAAYSITFPDTPSLTGTPDGGARATYSTAPDPTAPEAVVYSARGTTASELEVGPGTFATVFAQLVSQGAVLTGPEETFELEGMPAFKNSFTDPNGKPATMVLAGDGHRLYQLIVVGGTPEECEKFFNSFKLLG